MGQKDGSIFRPKLAKNDRMAKASNNIGSRAARVLGAKAFAAITAVEGLHLNGESKKRLERLRACDLSPEERRAEVLSVYASLKGDR